MTSRDGNSWGQPPLGDFINSIRSPHSTVLQFGCINLNLPHITLMSRGFCAASFQRPGTEDETGERVWEKDRESKQRQNDNKNVARAEKERLLLVFAVGLCLLSGSALDPVCPASTDWACSLFLCQEDTFLLARSRHMRRRYTQTALTEKEVAAWEHMTKFTDAKSKEFVCLSRWHGRCIQP